MLRKDQLFIKGVYSKIRTNQTNYSTMFKSCDLPVIFVDFQFQFNFNFILKYEWIYFIVLGTVVKPMVISTVPRTMDQSNGAKSCNIV